MEKALEKIDEIETKILTELTYHNFKKKRKNLYVRKVNDCVQSICILETKQKSRREVHISIVVGFTYEKVNEVISYLRGEKYNSKWQTASINMSTLISNNTPYGFNINEETEVDKVVEDIVGNIEKYSLVFLDENAELRKYYTKLRERDAMVTVATMALNKPEWNLLALSILIDSGSSEQIIDEYESEFKKRKFAKEELQYKVMNIGKEHLL
jgi:hypothetical protein